ncbi:unnamed protein product [Urochloa humidicola]
MAPTSAAVLVTVAVAQVALVLQLTSAATLPPIGLPGCDTACGNVSVPYPFGLGPSRCYWPGLNLTCDTTHNPPRLLLGDGTLRVTEISLKNGTVRVMRSGSIINTTGDFVSDGWNASFGPSFTVHGYRLSYKNELVVSGCNVVAALVVDDSGEEAPGTYGGCASFCDRIAPDEGVMGLPAVDVSEATRYSKYCGVSPSRCCQAFVADSTVPSGIVAKWIYSGNHTMEQKYVPVNVFVAEEGWVDSNGRVPTDEHEKVPMVLEWSVTKDLPRHGVCDNGIHRMLCKSQNSQCRSGAGFTCQCNDGYDGNPYLAGGCQDIDECNLPSEMSGCAGECTNTIGSYDCRCPHGTFGNPGIKGGCVEIHTTATDALGLTEQIGLPNCSTTCGDVRVPYPFGISPGCYLAGFNLTCDMSHHPPRLLLDSNGTLEVVDISLLDSTMRVIHHTRIVIGDFTSLDPNFTTAAASFHLQDMGEPYMLSSRNEFLLFGNGVQATLYGKKYRNRSSSSSNIASCVSNFSSGPFEEYKNCSGVDGCCHAPIVAGSTPNKIEFKWLMNRRLGNDDDLPLAFVSEKGLTAQWWDTILNRTYDLNFWMPRYFSSPIVLRWTVKQGFSSAPAGSSGKCPWDVASRLCRSDLSGCKQENGGYTCYCHSGYHGNPYIVDGCKDIDECKITPTRCFGVCKNLHGSFKCRCPLGKFGNPKKPNGCISSSIVLSKFIKNNKISLSAASGPVLLILVLGIMLIPRKIELHRMEVLKQRYFKQNRGQLLQKLMSQKADIAERMIIPLNELAKATNNFDKARELGGGGHGTVYKGILSDLQVVAIKKSKIAVQKEIDEFINEVAILSQINHKNVVKLFGCCLESEVPLLVYEFISNGTLYHHLHIEGPRSLSWGNRLRIATEVATSLAYLHSAVSIPIIHRDIKSSNILLDDTLTSKVSDFGASRYIPMDKSGLTTRIQGTRGYMDPMCFYTGRLTEKSDVYSFGVILMELLTRKKPFSYLSSEGDGLAGHFVNLHAEGNLIEIIDPQVIEEGGEEVQEVATLAVSCVNFRGEERPTMRQAEHTLEGFWGVNSKKYKKIDKVKPKFDNGGQIFKESSRRYSLEQDMMMSVGVPR